MPVPENDNVFETKGRMIQEIKVGMGGRIAEELIFDDVTTGASQDIKQVTDTARSMITKFGMSDRLGFINYEENTDEVFLGRDLGHSRSFSEEVASIIDKEVKKLVDDCYTDAKRILTENMDVLHSCANLLLEKERISREEFEALFEDAFELQLEETTLVPVNLQSWMDLTSTPEDIQKDIIDKMEYDLNGGDKTGFNPYIKEGQICFDHRWLLLIGKKEN